MKYEKLWHNSVSCIPVLPPYRPETNGVVERAVRSVLDGTRSVLLHAGSPRWYWPYACRYFCSMKNVQFIDGSSAWTSRHGEDRFPGQTIPFGALVNYLPTPVTKRPKAADKTRPAIFVGYYVAPGGRWRGDYFVIPLAQCRNMTMDEEGTPIHRGFLFELRRSMRVTRTPTYFPSGQYTSTNDMPWVRSLRSPAFRREQLLTH